MILEIIIWGVFILMFLAIGWIWMDVSDHDEEIKILRHRVLLLEKEKEENPFELVGKRKVVNK